MLQCDQKLNTSIQLLSSHLNIKLNCSQLSGILGTQTWVFQHSHYDPEITHPPQHTHTARLSKPLCAPQLLRGQAYLVAGQLLGNRLKAACLHEVGCHQPPRHLQQPLFHLLELTVVIFVVSDFCLETADMLLWSQVPVKSDFPAENILKTLTFLKFQGNSVSRQTYTHQKVIRDGKHTHTQSCYVI